MNKNSSKFPRRDLLMLCLVVCGAGPSWATEYTPNSINNGAETFAVSAKTLDATSEYSIHLTAGGTLQEKLLEAGADLAAVTHLTVTGPINGTDIDLLHGKLTALTTLDLGGATICAGGDSYHNWVVNWNGELEKGSNAYNTEDNVVGDYMFNKMPLLEKLVLPSSTTKVGEYAVANCAKLTDVPSFPQGVTQIGNFAFYNSGITSIQLGTALQSIGQYAFAESGLTSIVVPEGVTELPKYAFNDCENLVDVQLPNNMTSIGERAFYSCNNLESINLPTSLASLGKNAFYYCEKITNIEIPATLTKIDQYAFSYCTALENVVFNEGLVTIGSNAFGQCHALTKIELPSTLKTLETYAFYVCKAAKTVTLPAGLETIGNYAFASCSALTSVTLPESIITLPINLFSSCTSLETVNLSSATQTIGNSCFYGCSSLRNINLNLPTLENINSGAFQYCGALTNVTLSNSISTLGSSAFANCNNLQKINIPTGVTALPYKLFSGCQKLEEVVMHEGITSIGEQAFNDCQLLSTCLLPNGITGIGSSAFYNCKLLPITTLPASLQTIGSSAFSSCALLNLTSLPNTLTTIGNSAFRNTGITTLDLSNLTLTKFDNYIFQECNALTSVILPNNLNNTGENTFQSCKNLNSVTLPATLQTIGNNAFNGCVGLQSINLPEQLQTIGSNAFNNTGLLSISVPDNVTQLGSYAFASCNQLKSAKLSKGLPYTDDFTYFSYCENLETLRIYAGAAPKITYAYYVRFRGNCVLEVPMGTEDLYRNANYWKEFKEIRGFLTGDKLAEQDYAVLQEMYTSLGGASWTNQWDLTTDDLYPGKWYGVTTEGDQIVSINLSGNGLSGRIPASVFSLPALKTLNLSNGNIDMRVDDILDAAPNQVNLQKLYLQNNLLKGDVSALLGKLSTLQEADLSCNQLTEVSEPLNNSVLKKLKINSQFVKDGQFVYNPEELAAETIDLGLPHTITLNTLQRYNHSYGKYNKANDMTNVYHIHFQSNGEIYHDWISFMLIDTSVDGEFAIYPYSGYGYTLKPVNNTIHFMSAGLAYQPKPMLIRYLEGDINVDRYIDVTDLASLVNYFVNDNRASGVFNYSAADGDKNSTLNVLDIVLNVNHILNEELDESGEERPAMAYRSEGFVADVNLGVDEGGALLMHTSGDSIMALQIDLRGVNADNVKLSKHVEGFTMAKQVRKDGTVRVVIYSTAGQVLTSGTMEVLRGVNPGTIITNAVVSDVHAKRLPVNTNVDMTGITLPVDSEKANTIYDLSGRKVLNITRGVYIMGGQKVLK